MIVDLADKLHEKRLLDNRLKNERYLIRNEAVKLLNFICQFNLTEHGLEDLKSGLLDTICELNVKIAKDTGNDYSKISPHYREE